MIAVVPSRNVVWVTVWALPEMVEYCVMTCWIVVVCVLAAKMLVYVCTTVCAAAVCVTVFPWSVLVTKIVEPWLIVV